MPADTSAYPPDFAQLLDRYNKEVEGLMARLKAGSITTRQWQAEMESLLSKYSTLAWKIGANVDEISSDGQKIIAGWNKEQRQYLDGFATVIQAAGGKFDDAWNARAEMYGAGTVTTYWEGKTDGLPLPAQPGQGCQCKGNCLCGWEIVWIDKKVGNADAYWKLDPLAQHCQTCLTRSEMWNPVHIRNGNLQL